MTRNGKNIGLYLSGEVYGHIARDARACGVPVTTWVRNAVLAACPPELSAEQGRVKRRVKRRGPAQKQIHTAPPRVRQDKPARPGTGKQAPVRFAALVERHRDRVLDLDARGHLPNAICSITRLEYKVVRHILTTRKKPRKGEP